MSIAIIIIIFASVFVLAPIAKAVADRISRQGPAHPDERSADFLRLKEDMDRLSSEVARLQDEQTFLLRLLNDGKDRKLLEEGRDTE